MDIRTETPELAAMVAEYLRGQVQLHRAEAQFMDKPGAETRKRYARAMRASEAGRKALAKIAADEVMEAVERTDRAIKDAVDGHAGREQGAK